MAERSNTGEVILAFLLGGIVGAICGILFAPQSGKETRKKLKELAEEIGEKTSEIFEEGKEKVEGVVKEGREKIKRVIGKEKEASE